MPRATATPSTSGSSARSCAAATAGACPPAARRASAWAPTTRASTSARPPTRSPRASTPPAVRYQGNWFPHRLRAATDGEVLYVGDSAGHCFPLSGEGIRTAFYFGIAAGRELRAVLAGDKTRERALADYARLPRRPRAGLPPRAAPAAPRPGAPAARADPRAAGAQRRSRWSIAPSAGTSSRPIRGWLAQSAARWRSPTTSAASSRSSSRTGARGRC